MFQQGPLAVWKKGGTFGWDTSSEIFQLDKSQGLIE